MSLWLNRFLPLSNVYKFESELHTVIFSLKKLHLQNWMLAFPFGFISRRKAIQVDSISTSTIVKDFRLLVGLQVFALGSTSVKLEVQWLWPMIIKSTDQLQSSNSTEGKLVRVIEQNMLTLKQRYLILLYLVSNAHSTEKKCDMRYN